MLTRGSVPRFIENVSKRKPRIVFSGPPVARAPTAAQLQPTSSCDSSQSTRKFTTFGSKGFRRKYMYYTIGSLGQIRGWSIVNSPDTTKVGAVVYHKWALWRYEAVILLPARPFHHSLRWHGCCCWAPTTKIYMNSPQLSNPHMRSLLILSHPENPIVQEILQ